MELPTLTNPRVDTALPIRANERMLKDEPKCKKSKTDAEEPHRAKLRIDREDPK